MDLNAVSGLERCTQVLSNTAKTPTVNAQPTKDMEFQGHPHFLWDSEPIDADNGCG